MLYRVVYDGGICHVEADSFGDAVKLWNAKMVARFGPDSGWVGEEPESVERLDDDPVIRGTIGDPGSDGGGPKGGVQVAEP